MDEEPNRRELRKLARTGAVLAPGLGLAAFAGAHEGGADPAEGARASEQTRYTMKLYKTKGQHVGLAAAYTSDADLTRDASQSASQGGPDRPQDARQGFWGHGQQHPIRVQGLILDSFDPHPLALAEMGIE